MSSTEEQVPLLAENRAARPENRSTAGKTQNTTSEAPVPWGLLMAVWCANLVPGLAFEVIFPFISEMILHVGVTHDEKKVGFYSGLVESMFAVVQVITSIPCGWLADTAGRKSVVQLGSLGVAIGTISFGFSQTYMHMLISRSLCGAMGGTWSAMRTMMSEGLPREHHGLGFAGLSLSYRTGQIIGLPLGGFLAHPDKSIGGPFRSPFWADTYPFALPCVVGGGLALVAVVISQIYMHETLPNPWRPTICIRRQKTASNSCEGSDEVSVTPQRLTASMRDICTPTILNLLASNFLSVFFTELLFALYPLWAFSSRELGGLQLTPVQIGIHLSIRAFIHFALMLGFPAINRRWGTLTLYKRTTALWPVSIALLWLAGITAKRLDDSNAPIVWTILVIQFTLWSVTSFSWAALGILINDSTPFPAARSKLNAIMQITIVIPQALAPAAGTSLFALSIRTTFLNGYVVWLVLVLASMLHALHAAICLRRQPVSSETDA